jgi:hypothetical protein
MITDEYPHFQPIFSYVLITRINSGGTHGLIYNAQLLAITV